MYTYNQFVVISGANWTLFNNSTKLLSLKAQQIAHPFLSETTNPEIMIPESAFEREGTIDNPRKALRSILACIACGFALVYDGGEFCKGIVQS